MLVKGNITEKVNYLYSEINNLSKYEESLLKWKKLLLSTPDRMRTILDHYIS